LAKDPALARLGKQLGRLYDDEVEEMGQGVVTSRSARPLAAWRPHQGQEEPAGDWRVWMILAGRGFGKTRAGAEWVMRQARSGEHMRIALVGATIDEVANVMVLGQSGLFAVAGGTEELAWYPSRRLLQFANGAQAFAYSGERPDKLRGPEHHVAWCDELAKWARPQETWDNLMLGLRLGPRPRVLVTTTPRPIALVKRLEADPAVVKSRGCTGDNPHLPPAFVEEVRGLYGGTRLGRQELDGELLEDVEGALWTRELVEKCRAWPSADAAGPSIIRCADDPPPRSREDFWARVVIGVDPPASAGGDACGIVAVALGEDQIGYVLGDHSVRGLSPEGWARAVAGAADAHGADRVVAEANQGGDMVASVLRAADCALPVKLVHARRGKAARAEPVAALFEGGRARFAGAFPELEDQLCGMSAGGGYAGPGRSPDRADAMVWAFTELMLGRKGAPAVRGL
jgi:phage terminase large subunit-like protein